MARPGRSSRISTSTRSRVGGSLGMSPSWSMRPRPSPICRGTYRGSGRFRVGRELIRDRLGAAGRKDRGWPSLGGDDLFEQGEGAVGGAVGVGEEGPGGVARVARVVVEPAGEAFQLDGALAAARRRCGSGSDAAGPRRCGGSRRRRAARRESRASRISAAAERLEGIPEVGRSRSGLARGVDELQVLDDELDVGDAADPALEVLRRPRGLELPPHRQDLGGQVAGSTGAASIARMASVTSRAEAAGREDHPRPGEGHPLPGLRSIARR